MDSAIVILLDIGLIMTCVRSFNFSLLGILPLNLFTIGRIVFMYNYIFYYIKGTGWHVSRKT